MYISYFNLHLMPLFAILHLAIFVSQLGFLLVKLSFSYLPERVDLVTLELKVVALFSLSIQLFSNANNMLLELKLYFKFCCC